MVLPIVSATIFSIENRRSKLALDVWKSAASQSDVENQ
jgi:hypothetical protein